MNNNENLIRQFYTCFRDKDIKGLQNCYADNASFSDPVFKNLDAKQVRSMWEMLIKSGKDMRIVFDNIKAGDHKGSAEWVAHYTFSVTGKKVVNKIKASFTFENGKIVCHQDEFSFYKWARQALGMPGILLGWTPFLRNKIRKKAADNLKAYMAVHG